jgi:DNA-directed RNA polymerase specialized sigma24 family protein
VTEIHPILYDLVPALANSITRRYRLYVEIDDVKQECFKWALTRTEYIAEQLNEEDTEKRRHNEQKLAWQMRRVAERYARREKAQKSGYQITDEAYYESSTLGQLLPFIIASVIDGTVLEQAQEMIQDGQPRGSSSPAEGGNLLATLLDIKRCYLELDQKEQTLLVYRYYNNLTLTQVSELEACAVSTADRKINNAMRKLIQKLGGESPFK